MKEPKGKNIAKALLLSTLTALLAGTHGAFGQDDKIQELEVFIAEETSVADSDSLIPTDRKVDGLMFSDMDILDIPRSVSVISPETIEQYALTNVYELAQMVSGASVTNFYGVPGIPTTRGLFTSIYFNGMQRVWNRNGYPTSFGSLEAMEYVKGPAPANYSAASPGGYVNFVPKSPYFDEFRGSLQVTVGSYDKYHSQFDIGGPVLLGGKPAAFRLSITHQDSDTYYDGIEDNYLSLYGSLKIRLNERLSIFVGGEFYRHRSMEKVGWNRVTQDLIDHGEYIVGAPSTDLTGDEYTYDDGGLSFTFTNTTPGAVNRAALETATPFGGTRGSFDGSFLALSGFTDSGFRIENFSPEAIDFYTTLGGIDNPGTGVTTEKIKGNQILSSDSDFADADTYLFFFDTIFTPSDTFKITNKVFIDAYSREKTSDYGYGELGDNFTIENKIVVDQRVGESVHLTYGISARYEDALAKTEFTVEPFSRRDILGGITPNDVLFSGGQRDDNGVNFWDPFGSWDTQMWTFGAFGTTQFSINDHFSIFASGRVDHATWDRAVPSDLGAEFNSGPQPGGGTTYTNWSISPSFKVNENVTLYYTYQIGTAFQGFYVSGGVSGGDTNFQEASLHEAGLRASLAEGKLYLGVSAYHQDLVDFDFRGGQAIPQRGKGVEFDLSYQITPQLFINASLTWQEHHYRSATLPGGFVPLTPEEMVNFAGIFYADFGGRPNPGGPRFGIPEWSGNVLVKYEMDNGFGISGGPTFVDSMYANPDKTLTLPSYTLLNGNIYYRTEKWEIMLSGKNLTSEDYFHPFDAFAANAVILKEPPATMEAKFTYKF